MDKAIAWYIYQHVIDGYKFLMQNYVVGDTVCLFGMSGSDGGPMKGGSFISILLLGFSRGAYIARALAGMLYKVCHIMYRSLIVPTRLAVQVGLLSEDNTEQIAFAYNLYESNKKSDEDLVPGFRETFCRPVPIDFVGVWWAFMTFTPCFGQLRRWVNRDTVSSVGIWGKTLPFVDGSDMTIREFRQALSINEVRAARQARHILSTLTSSISPIEPCKV
jgi:uncharacterized protein (DUF2235 family)